MRSATDLAARVRERQVSPVEVVDAYLDRIDRRAGWTNSVTAVLADSARALARQQADEVVRGRIRGPLHGLPIMIKDLFDFKAGVPNSFGVPAFARYLPPGTAAHVRRLEDAGAIVVAKTNTCEFGHKGTTDNRLFGPTSTPHRRDLNAGGSSGGSAAAVADFLCTVAQGSDGGGSVRIPAALCGIVGMKPTNGLLPAVVRPDAFFAAAPFMSNGPLTRSVEDCALLLDVMVGFEPADPFSVRHDQVRFRDQIGSDVAGLRVAYLPTLGGFPVEDDIARAVARAVSDLAGQGVIVDEPGFTLPLPHDEITSLWVRMAGSSLVSVRESFAQQGVDIQDPGCWDDLPPGLRAALEAAYSQTVLEVRRDQLRRTLIFDAIAAVLVDYDAIITPTLSVAGVPNGDDGWTVGPRQVAGQQVDPLLGWCLTHPFNFSGHPAISVPAGATDAGLPVGLQIAGRRFEDSTVLTLAGAVERSWRRSTPPAATSPARDSLGV